MSDIVVWLLVHTTLYAVLDEVAAGTGGVIDGVPTQV